MSGDDAIFAEFMKAMQTCTAKHIGIAVSGGGDSIALLHLAALWAKDRGVSLGVCSVDHQLRAEAADEIALVSQTASSLDIPHFVRVWTSDKSKANLQARARKARYGLLADWAKSQDIECVLLGHTIDDQAETFLINLSRSAGVDGLAGMPQIRVSDGIEWRRPILTLGRTTLREYLKSHGLKWADDPSNLDERFQRVKIRKSLQLLASAGISVESIAAVVGNMQMVKPVLDGETRKLLNECEFDATGSYLIARAKLRGIEPEVIRRTYSRIYQSVSGADYPPRRQEVLNAMAMIEKGKTFTLSGVLVIADLKHASIVFTRELNAVQNMVAKSDMVWDGRWVISGPIKQDMQIRVLGEKGLQQVKLCHKIPFLRQTVVNTPAVWSGDHLIAAPVLDKSSKFYAKVSPIQELMSHSH